VIQIQEDEIGGACSMRGKRYTIFWLEKPEVKRPLGRPRRKCKDTIRMDLRKTGWEGVEWMHLAQDRKEWRALVNRVMNIRVQ
jgi:hypothetical protein